ncbi:hypothetical protein DL93DRAFT_2036912, partial [Clavulina sp. PMI_390]
ACFICEDEGETRGPDDVYEFQCTSCASPAVPFENGPTALAHIGAHILHDPRVNRAQEPCGLCLRPAPLCQFFLKRSPGTAQGVTFDFDKSQCINCMRFSYKPASVSTTASPCSNVPIICPICVEIDPHSPAIWKYNLEAHFTSKHSTVDRNQFSKLWEIPQSERVQLKEIYKRR